MGGIGGGGGGQSYKITFSFPLFLGCHNDARMNISIAISAARHGATIANHVRVKELIKVPIIYFWS